MQDELLVVENLLRIAVFNIDPERLGSAVIPLVPYERGVGAEVQLYPYQGACDRKDVGFKLEAGELVDLVKNCLAHLWEVDDFTDLLRVHIIEVVPLELSLFLDLTSDIIKVHHLCELTERCHGAPEALFNHLAHVKHHLAEVGPAALQADLEERPHDSAGALRDVDHVGVEVVAFHLEARDVGLEQDVDLCGRLIECAFDGYRNTFNKLLQLKLLILPDRHE